jgi:hypothetical protein
VELGSFLLRNSSIHQWPDNIAEAMHKPGVLSFQFGNGVLFLYRYIAWLLEEAPTQLP